MKAIHGKILAALKRRCETTNPHHWRRNEVKGTWALDLWFCASDLRSDLPYISPSGLVAILKEMVAEGLVVADLDRGTFLPSTRLCYFHEGTPPLANGREA